jgi:dihydrofolate reductase
VGKVRVPSFGVSIDGFGAGPNQDDFAREGFEHVGAWIVGRNMFGPVRGAWLDDACKGWWGDDPPFHTPVFVLTHYARGPLHMEGGTTFYFVTEGIEAALGRAKQAAGDRDVRIGGTDLPELGYAVTEHVATERATHLRVERAKVR